MFCGECPSAPIALLPADSGVVVASRMVSWSFRLQHSAVRVRCRSPTLVYPPWCRDSRSVVVLMAFHNPPLADRCVLLCLTFCIFLCVFRLTSPCASHFTNGCWVRSAVLVLRTSTPLTRSLHHFSRSWSLFCISGG